MKQNTMPCNGTEYCPLSCVLRSEGGCFDYPRQLHPDEGAKEETMSQEAEQVDTEALAEQLRARTYPRKLLDIISIRQRFHSGHTEVMLMVKEMTPNQCRAALFDIAWQLYGKRKNEKRRLLSHAIETGYMQPGDTHQEVRVPTALIPEGAQLIEAYRTPEEYIVLGEPGDMEGHNCDVMGCATFSHVLWRWPRPPAREDEL